MCLLFHGLLSVFWVQSRWQLWIYAETEQELQQTHTHARTHCCEVPAQLKQLGTLFWGGPTCHKGHCDMCFTLGGLLKWLNDEIQIPNLLFFQHITLCLAGGDGTLTSTLRWGQAGGRRVGVSASCLRWGDPLQRSTIIRNTHFSCSSSHILLHSASPCFLSRLPPALFPLLSSNLTVRRLFADTQAAFIQLCNCIFLTVLCFLVGRCVRANWIWQSHTVHVVVQRAPH